jgi:carbonic anhydrase/acetyltransferase-like protein (isoleucine patch superfamily)
MGGIIAEPPLAQGQYAARGCVGSMGHIDPTAWIAPSAVVTGDVTIGAGSRVLHGAVVTGDTGPVKIGSDVLVMENAVLRGRSDHPLRIGDAVLVGPHAHVNGTTIEDEVFVATGVSTFAGAHIGARSELRINSVLHVNTTLPPDSVVPIGSRSAIRHGSSHRTVTTSCGRCRRGSTSPARCTACPGAPRCARSCAVRATGTGGTPSRHVTTRRDFAASSRRLGV